MYFNRDEGVIGTKSVVLIFLGSLNFHVSSRMHMHDQSGSVWRSYCI